MAALLQLAPNTIFAGEYRVVRLLSEGGMGAVYVVEQVSTGKQRALKVMHPQLVTNDKLRQRFEQEARIGGHIESDHVVQVLGAGIDSKTGTPWLVMELLQGQTLGERLAQQRVLPIPLVREIFLQLCHALGAAHRAGIVHRDLKPENIFLEVPKREGVQFTLKILDFGIAKMVAEAGTQHTAAIGTPLWMAPEQTESRAVIGPTADVWALGLIAFHLLTGRMYWREANVEGGSSMVLMREIVIDPLVPASQRARELGVAQHLPASFDQWFARCVVRDPAQRFRDATETRQALEAAFSQTPFEATRMPATPVYSPAPIAAAPMPIATAYAPPPATPAQAPIAPFVATAPGRTSSSSTPVILAACSAAVILAGLLFLVLARDGAPAPPAPTSISTDDDPSSTKKHKAKKTTTAQPPDEASTTTPEPGQQGIPSFEEALKTTTSDPSAGGIGAADCKAIGTDLGTRCELAGTAKTKYLVQDGVVKGVTVTTEPDQPLVAACMQKAIAAKKFPVAKASTACVLTFKSSGPAIATKPPTPALTPTTPTGIPPPATADAPPFDKAAARSSLAAIVYKDCAPAESGVGTVVLTFKPSTGNPSSANVSAFQPAVNACLAERFKKAHVPPFSGDPVTVSWKVSF